MGHSFIRSNGGHVDIVSSDMSSQSNSPLHFPVNRSCKFVELILYDLIEFSAYADSVRDRHKFVERILTEC